MARSIWSGAISFGLVNVPVKLYSAVQRKTIRFHQLNAETQARIQQKRVDSTTGEEVPYEQIVKGYEIAPDRYVVITPEELESVDPKQSRSIDIQEFVDLDEIDPIYYDHNYYLAPGQGAAKAYALLVEAMEKSGKVAIARFVMRNKEYLAAIRPVNGVLNVSTMVFSDEIADPDRIDELSEEPPEANEREVQMAQQLIDSLSAEFDPSKYHDEYRERVMEMIEAKAQGEEIAVQPAPEAPTAAPDLMAALEASIKAAKESGGDGGDGKPAKEKTSAKKSSANGASKGRGKAKAKS
jgi:DNA end-binding protein Ku